MKNFTCSATVVTIKNNGFEMVTKNLLADSAKIAMLTFKIFLRRNKSIVSCSEINIK